MAEMMIACFDIDLHSKHEDRVLKWPPRPANIYLTKSPSDYTHAYALLRLMSGLHVIFMLRDPRDSVVSKHNLHPEQYWSNLGFWKRFMNSKYQAQLMAHPRVTVVKYEELVADPDRIQARIMEAMPFLVRKTAFSNYHKVAKPSDKSITALSDVRPPSASSVGSWQRHLPRIAGQIARHGSITDDLIVFGYEKDEAWLQLLDGVEPDMSPGFLADSIPGHLLRKRRRWLYLRVLLARVGHTRPAIHARRLLRSLKRKQAGAGAA